GLPFDAVISVATAGTFKPHVQTYRSAAEALEVGADRVMFVANHPFDCVGAKAFGMRTAFVNRRHRPFGQTEHAPDLTVGDFPELADVLLGGRRLPS
ncbi:MAG: HAD hydrolase-like protein, partial [Acidimicrobiales bacterium]